MSRPERGKPIESQKDRPEPAWLRRFRNFRCLLCIPNGSLISDAGSDSHTTYLTTWGMKTLPNTLHHENGPIVLGCGHVTGTVICGRSNSEDSEEERVAPSPGKRSCGEKMIKERLGSQGLYLSNEMTEAADDAAVRKNLDVPRCCLARHFMVICDVLEP